MMDLEQLEKDTRLLPVCNPGDQRLDILIALQAEYLRELRLVRELLQGQQLDVVSPSMDPIEIGEYVATLVEQAGGDKVDADSELVDVTQHSTGELQPVGKPGRSPRPSPPNRRKPVSVGLTAR